MPAIWACRRTASNSRPAASTTCRIFCAPKEAGGILERDGMVEVVSSLERDGRPVFRDLRWGVYVVLKAPNDYARACFKEYGLKTDPSGWYAAMYKPYHLIGLELGISVLSAALRGEPTGQALRLSRRCRGRRQARLARRRDARRRRRLYGVGQARAGGAEPGRRVLYRSASRTKSALLRDIAAGEIVRWADVALPETEAVRVRREMERRFGAPPAAIAAQ